MLWPVSSAGMSGPRVIGGASALGRRVEARLAASPVGPAAASPAGDGQVLVHLPSGDHDTLARRRESIIAGVVESLRQASEQGVTHFVLLSSAMVYGAWPNNPVPLTEDAILRPDVDFVYARQLAAAEALADRWRRRGAGRSVTVLRPVITMAGDATSVLARSLAAGLGQRFGEDDPPSQFLHLDDLAAAVVLAVERRLDGVFNVAPDGWVAGERVRALTGGSPRLRLPERANVVIAAWRWRLLRGPVPPGMRSYTRWPWVVSNDRLEMHGWTALVTNDEAYVEATEGRWWTLVTPKRRQELALGAMVAAAVLGGLGALAGVSRWRRSRRG